MPYIGRGLVQGNYVKLDDLQSQFDGSKTTFTLTSGGQSYKPGSANTLLVSLGGVIQEAVTSYTVVNDQITFSNPPTSDANIFIIALGSAVSIGTPADGTITAPKLNASFGEYSGIGTIVLSGIISATSLRGSGALLTGVSAGKFISETAGIVTNTPVGVNTSTVDDNDLTGIGNSFKGLYVANGMVITDKELTGVHYICLLYTSPSPRDLSTSRMPSSA